MNDDNAPDLESCAYAWSNSSDLNLEDFLKKKPSMVQNDGTKPWIWVKGSEPAKEDGDVDGAIEEATTLLEEVTERVEQIKNDDSIPNRSNKKTGARSKKEVREQVQAEATEKLKEISQRHGYVSGKWLIFAPPDRVDIIWSKLATSLVSGPLSPTPAYLAKVATSPQSDQPNYQHVMCLYMPDVYDKHAVITVMKVLLRNHGLNLTGVKSDLYTSIGLDSKHASGIQSTVWKNTALLKDSEIKELKDAFFSELNSPKPANEKNPEATRGDKDGGNKQTSKAKLKKKMIKDDPFGSDDGEEKSQPKNAKRKAPPSKEKPPKNSDYDGSGSEDARKIITNTKVKKGRASATKEEKDSDSDVDRPKRRRTGAQ